MASFRIKEKNGKFFPQERFLLFFWLNICYKDHFHRGSFSTYKEAQKVLSDHIMRMDSNAS